MKFYSVEMSRPPTSSPATQAFADRLDRFLIVCALGWALFGLQHIWLHRWCTVVIDFAVTLSTLALRRAARAQPDRARRVAHYNIALSSTGLVLAALISGQSRSLAVWYLVPVPLFAGYQLGQKAGLLWGLAAAALGFLVDASEYFVTIPPEFVPEGLEMSLSRMVLILACLAFSVASQSVNERQLKIAQANQRRVEAASQAKSRFIASVEHELRTPLNAILGFNQLLRDEMIGPLNPKQLRYAENVGSSGQHLLGLVNRILALSNSEHHSGQAQFEVAVLLEEFLRPFRLSAAAKDISLTAAGPCLTVVANEVVIKTILENLLSNAVKFTPRGGRIQVDWSFHDRSLSIAVADTGPGVPHRDRERIFELFEQGSSGYDRRYGGLGLGLALCQQILESVDGRLALIGPGLDGRGASFRCEIPAELG